MEKLSPEQKQHLCKFFGVSQLLNVADTSIEWRNLVTDKTFLDDICRRRFGLLLDELPELSDYEKLLINTQQMVFQSMPTKFFGCHPSLAKIYAMELRASWYPYSFKKANVTCSKNIPLRDILYPWPYDCGRQFNEETRFYSDIKKFSARLHAAFPPLFERLVKSVILKEENHGKFEYFTGQYPAEMESDGDAQESDFGLIDRQPRVINIVTPKGQALWIFIYDDDETWRVIHRGPGIMGSIAQRSSQIVPWNSSVTEIRNLAGSVLRRFCHLASNIVEANRMKCPSLGPLGTTRVENHMFQMDFVKILEGAIRSSAYKLVKSLENTELDKKRRDKMFQKLIKQVDALYPCADMDHTHCDEGRNSSTKLIIALSRALRRLVNDNFLPEAKRSHENLLTRQLTHAWSWQGKGRKRDKCYDMGAPEGFEFKKKCYMFQQVSNSMCCHHGLVDLWPAITLKKATDAVPELAKKVESDTMEFVSRCNR